MTNRSAHIGVVLGLCFALLPTPSAHADDASRIAMEHFKKGTRAYDLGRFLEAAAEYEKAYEAKDNPALLYNLGQAYRGAGEHQKALNCYRAYLRNAPDAPNREEVTKFIEALRITIAMQKATAEKPPMGPMPEPKASATTTQPSPLPPPKVEPSPPPRVPDPQALATGRKLRIAGIVVGGVGAGALIAGGVFAGQTASIDHQLNSPSGGMPVYNKSLESRGRTYQTLETTFFVVGGAAAVAAVATLVAGTVKIKRNSFALAPTGGPGQAGLSFAGSF